jgi:endonuclease G
LDGVALERIIGSSDLLDVNYLDLGTKASQSVCRIQVRSEIGAVLGFGTGFLISPTLLLTNNHVIDKLELAKRSLVDFGYEDDDNFVPKMPKTFTLEPNKFFYTNPNLDFTIVAVSPNAIDGSSLSNFAFLPLIAESGKILLGECLTIIGHNAGATKQITLRDNKVVDVFENYVHYLTDTEPGASGSPAFNDQWEVAALHHAGVRKKDSEGRVLSKARAND